MVQQHASHVAVGFGDDQLEHLFSMLPCELLDPCRSTWREERQGTPTLAADSLEAGGPVHGLGGERDGSR